MIADLASCFVRYTWFEIVAFEAGCLITFCCRTWWRQITRIGLWSWLGWHRGWYFWGPWGQQTAHPCLSSRTLHAADSIWTGQMMSQLAQISMGFRVLPFGCSSWMSDYLWSTYQDGCPFYCLSPLDSHTSCHFQTGQSPGLFSALTYDHGSRLFQLPSSRTTDSGSILQWPCCMKPELLCNFESLCWRWWLYLVQEDCGKLHAYLETTSLDSQWLCQHHCHHEVKHSI